MRLGEILIQRKLITEEDLERALELQKERGDKIGKTLVDMGFKGEGPAPKLSDDLRVEAARRYIQLCELITGRPFVPDTDEPLARIRRNLKLSP